MKYNTLQRIAFYLLSMSLFFIVIGVLCMDIPVCFDDGATFIGFDTLWNNIKAGVIIIMSTLIIEYLIFKYLKACWSHNAQELSVRIIDIKERNYEMVMFIASFFVPLVSFQLDHASNWIVLAILFVSIGVIFCNSTGFYNNPTLALFGFHFYDIKVATQKTGKEVEEAWVIVSKENLSLGNRIKYVKLANNIGIATKF